MRNKSVRGYPDHAGDYVDRKSTNDVCTFIGCYLTSWFSKKQTALAISTTEAEYVSARKACQQALWMKQSLIDYGVRLDDIPIMCDNKGAIDLSKNPIQHLRTKHIEIRHHFLRDNVQKGNISIEKIFDPGLQSQEGLIRLLVKLASGSMIVVEALFDLNISSILKDILSTYDLSHGMPSPRAFDGQDNQVHEVLKLLIQLVPVVTRNQDVQLAEENAAFLKNNPR
ncbi:hypothetical protein Tco_1081043 [Tanacetum coccineum]|uniref:Copia protein n=1 Tax=Tanacetum coccineum TaxID=301880 RepID=A0ABQ5HYE1_9ASTR